MNSALDIAKRVLARFGVWPRDSIATVPPELAACEYECREKVCDEDRFDDCERRLHAADAQRRVDAEAAARGDAEAAARGGERPEPCIAPAARSGERATPPPQARA